MKKLLFGISAIALVASLSGCNTSGNTNTPTTSTVSQEVESSVPSASEEPVTQAAATAAAETAPITTAAVSNNTGNTGITEDQARAAALTHAGFTEADVTWLSSHLDRDDGRQIYEVEFFSGNIEYDYDIDAQTGDIISYSQDADHQRQQPADTTVAIDETAAKNLALANVAGAADSDIRIRLDYDDGRPIYEGTIVYNEMKYEFEISAVDGSILEWDVESIYD